MSTWATKWAWEQKADSPAEKLILLALAECADFDATCFPGQQALAEMTHQTDRSVRQHLKNLEARGLLKRTARWRKDGTRTSDSFQLAGGKRPAEKSSGSASDNRKITTGVPETASASPPENFSGDPDPALILSENLSPKNYPQEFESLWDQYPHRPGDSKSKGFAAFKKTLRTGMPQSVGFDAVRRYAKYIAECSSAQYAKGFAVFFGPDEHWREPWTPTARNGHTSAASGWTPEEQAAHNKRFPLFTSDGRAARMEAERTERFGPK